MGECGKERVCDKRRKINSHTFLCVQFDADEEERVKQAKKQAKLDNLEQQWKAEQQKSSSWWFWSPFSVTFPSSVLENLQVCGAHTRPSNP